jgi:hypothetical protein
MMKPADKRTEIGVCVFLIVVAGAFIWDARDIPAGVFEPLGAGPVPRLICWVVIGLCVTIIGQSLFASPPAKQPEPEATYKPHPWLAAATLALTCVYVAVMAAGMVGFAVATIVYLALTISMLADFERRGIIIALVIALVMGLGCQYIFTEVLIIDLPSGD